MFSECHFWPSSSPRCPTFLSVCHVVKPNWDLEWLVVIGRASGARPHTPIHTYRIHTHWPQQRSLKRSDPTTVWVTVCLSLLQIEQLALSVWFCTLTQKDNSSVCAWGDYSIPVLLLSLSHANPGLPTLQSSETTQTHKKHKVATHREHGKLSNHFKRNG